MKGRAFTATLFATAAFFCCIAVPAVAAPPLWVVQSASGGKIYLFGTVHVLRDDTQWRSPELEAAIKDSQNLYLEIADMTNVAAGTSSLFKAGIDREHPLSTKISKDDVALLDEAAKRYGVQEASFEPMRPWLVYLMLTALSASHSGYHARNGVDLQIRKEFAADGKPIYGFETFDVQAHIFADLSEPTQVALLETELKAINRPAGPAVATAGLDRIVDDWMSGNEEQLATAMEIDKLAKTPFYTAMFTNRNKAWANVLAERLKQPGTSFVCVGAGHLVGANGVPALLAQMGYTVSRVPIAEIATVASPSPSPTASAPATPIPQILTPPAGWKPRAIDLHAGNVKADRMWVDPNHKGVVMTAHLDVPDLGPVDLTTLDGLVHQGMVAEAGAGGVQPSTRVKICGGKEDGTLTKVTLKSVTEDIVLAVSDRGYLAEYVRRNGVAEDPAATRSILTLCAP